MIYKNLSCEILRDGKTKGDLLSFVASTSNADRYGDIIDQKGWDLSKYKQNPIILLNHNANSLPIARGYVEVVDDKLMVDIEFDMEDPQAKEIARKTKAGFLNAVSVGFNPIDGTPRSQLEKSHPAHGISGQFFEKAELLEISIVTIPANGEAVASKGLQMEKALFSNGTLKTYIGTLKHIIDVDIQDDVVVVTYAKQPDQELEEVEEIEELDEEVEEVEESEELAYESEKDEEQDEEQDEDKKDKFLTPQERDFLRLFLME